MKRPRTKDDTEYDRYSKELDKVKIRCKCGHRNVIPVWVDKVVCHWCGYYVYRNKELEKVENENRRKKQFKENLIKVLRG